MCRCHRHHPPPGSVTGEHGEREEEMCRDAARGGALALLFTSITGEAAQRLGRGRQLVRVSISSAP